ncbi:MULTISPECIES: bifunctional UDP-sugar hydrolase/5'-nucleotidase [unclassified Bacillus (in: firmicutes)]|uniref:bifunctional metallophosphatase/5'-nucleotidase n=1 Tax=unclassified Bacillus (in: firmicutes) TaxID=185979 RepID=UPI001BE6BADB|nr:MULTISPECIES: bifunctional UDP-sugar hydrolase/5'-nucleotidase [unclassified Bacillus (in: firmicutes)]MBT2640586.1 bifunctional metallophosphatase/5'-nucleotidase [Bacillus sp. ISL-39]MBT2663485.1 bifunctional metallophosphatase/5'-nucleotidase [Bacillus sp. ISL-45]
MDKCELVVLQTSDIHGNILPISYGNNEEINSGLAKLGSAFKNVLKNNDCNLLIDNGDVIQGTPLTYHFARNMKGYKNPVISVMNYLGYDVAVIGNHEFNYGQDLLKNAISESNFPWLSANIVKKETKEPAFGKPYFIKSFSNGLRIAVIGVTTHFIPNWENPVNIQGLEFLDAFHTLKEWVGHLQENEQYDLLIASYHGGFEKDLETAEPSEKLTGENQAYRMCTEISGIDILLTGHQHRQLSTQLNDVLVVQPGHNGQAFSKVSIKFEKSNGKWIIMKKSAEIIEIEEDTPLDDKILGLAKVFEELTQQWLDQPLGEIAGDMRVHSPLEVRKKDHPLIEFINKVQMDAAGVEISSTALFHNGAPGFPGKITMRDIVSNYVYPNTLKVITVSGQDIKDALEQSAEYFILNNEGEIQVNPSFEAPKPQHYNYDMWEGIEYHLDISKPAGKRVTLLKYRGEPLKLDEEFDVVVNNYRAGGGGNFNMFKDKPVKKEIQTDMTELLANYIQRHRKIEATCNDNWRVLSHK